MATENKDFRVKNGLVVEGSTATVNGNSVLTTASSLDALGDVVITSAITDQVLKFNGTNWVNATDATGGGGGDLNGLSDVTITSISDNEILQYDSGTSSWINQTISEAGLVSGVGTAKISYQTTAPSSPTTGDIWIDSDATAPTANLDDLGDVTITSNTSGEVLVWNGSAWINQTLSEAGIVEKSIVDAKGDLIVATAADTISRLAVGATNGHVLTVDSAEATGLKWAAAAGGGASALDDLTDVTVLDTATITVVNTSSVDADGNTSATLTLPASMQEGDLCFVIVGSDTTQPNLPSGWSDASAITYGSGFQRTIYKVMGATPDTTVSLTGLSSSGASAVAIAFRNAEYSTITTATAVSGMPNPPSVTTTINNSVVLIVGAVDDDSFSDTAAPSGYSNLIEQEAVGRTGMTVMAAAKTVATAGAEDPGAFTGSGTDDWYAASIILTPKTLKDNDILVYNSGLSQWVNQPNTGLLSTGFTAGDYYTFPMVSTSNANFTGTGITRYMPFYIPETTTFSAIATRTGTTFSGTSAVRLGIYNNTDFKPSTLVVDAGQVSCTSPSSYFEAAIDQTLNRGWYWLAWNQQTAATTSNYILSTTPITGFHMSPVASTGASFGSYNETGITGAFSSANPNGTGTNPPLVYLRKA